MSTKYPTMWHNMYIGRMTEDMANAIMKIRSTKVIPSLKKMIFCFPPELVLRSLNEYKSIRSIIKEDNIDYKDYISELRDYQTVGTAFMYMAPRSILADSCGMGKTVELAGLINLLKQKNEISRFLIAVESSAPAQIQTELIKFTGLNVVQLPSESAKMKKAIDRINWEEVEGIVIKHSSLRSDTFYNFVARYVDKDGYNHLYNTFILDESSVIKNENTKIFEYTKNLCDISSRVHFLNATTFETNIIDIYNQLDIMNSELLPKKWKIERQYCTFSRESYWTKENGKAKMNWAFKRSGYKNQSEFKQSLKLVYFGRSKKEVGKDMPHIYKVYEVEPSSEQLKALKTKKYRYNELLNCPTLVPDANIVFDRKHCPKLDRLCEIINNEFADMNVMVYCFHIEAQATILKELEAIGRRSIILNGGCSDEERIEAQVGFNDGKYDVIITNIKKSLNLQGGDACIFYSMETNIAKIEQIAGRIDRSTDDRVKTFIMLLYANSPEYEFFTGTVLERARDSRKLTIDTETTTDKFIKYLKERA